ncbi:MAG: S1 RNA-binding domain-containing protein [Candidatus Marsarchaeota archaeon]|jgi:translation initiation factor 2 subunit 1|nr:S1 RNA-binding domain-containing protein [Candidatus Marsarchaeota archaeon]MCL5418732.1 S1 RNA-binding domain-containing protein [Candidatus Marsarchaeota archaeon]
MQTGTNARMPKIGEFIIAQISKVMPFGAYCTLPEYNNLEVFLPIKEISSGWIKNIHEFIREGQMVVCTVAYYDKERNTVDVSIKKVPQGKAKEKIRQYNLEKRLQAMLHQVLKSQHADSDEARIKEQLLSEFGSYVNFAENTLSDTAEFKSSKLPKKVKEAFLEQLEHIQKNKKYEVSYIATVYTTNAMNGATDLRNALGKAAKTGVDIKYISAPKYRIMAAGTDYSDAEGKIKKAEAALRSSLPGGFVELEKEKLKKEKESIFDT